MPSGRALAAAARSSSDHFTRAEAAGRHRGHDLLASGRLGLGRNRVFQIEDHRVAGQGLRLFQRARIGTGHVKHAAARTGGHVGILLWLSGPMIQVMQAAHQIVRCG
jgi:hypothetical protein